MTSPQKAPEASSCCNCGQEYSSFLMTTGGSAAQLVTYICCAGGADLLHASSRGQTWCPAGKLTACDLCNKLEEVVCVAVIVVNQQASLRCCHDQFGGQLSTTQATSMLTDEIQAASGLHWRAVIVPGQRKVGG